MNPFLKEIHFKYLCKCSICELVDKRKYVVGFLWPENKEWNSWRWFYIRTSEAKYYIRWHGFWMKKPNVKVK